MTIAAPRLDVEKSGQDAKEPVLAWEGKEGNVRYRIVVVYNTSGNPPLPVLEKLSGTASLGEELWVRVPLPPEIPLCILREVAKEV
jgi:hypothetical protein